MCNLQNGAPPRRPYYGKDAWSMGARSGGGSLGAALRPSVTGLCLEKPPTEALLMVPPSVFQAVVGTPMPSIGDEKQYLL